MKFSEKKAVGVVGGVTSMSISTAGYPKDEPPKPMNVMASVQDRAMSNNGRLFEIASRLEHLKSRLLGTTPDGEAADEKAHAINGLVYELQDKLEVGSNVISSIEFIVGQLEAALI